MSYTNNYKLQKKKNVLNSVQTIAVFHIHGTFKPFPPVFILSPPSSTLSPL